MAIVEREYASELSLDDIARRVASSRRQLQRAYSEIGSTTFRDHLTEVRMERAAEMLATRGLTVREVAHRVGYRQPAQFAKAFRRHQGLAPSDYRASAQARVADAAPIAAMARADVPARRPAACPASTSVARPLGCASVPRGAEEQAHARRGDHAAERSPTARRRRLRARCSSIGADGVGRRHRARRSDRLVPDAGVHAGEEDRHAVGRPADRLGAGLRPRRDDRPLLASGGSACARARSSRTARRSTATRGSRSSGPRSRRSCWSRSARTPTSC